MLNLFGDRWGGGVGRGAFAQPSQDVGFVQVKAIEQVALMRVIYRLFVGVGLQATAQVVKSLKTLVDHHPLAKQVKRQ